MKRMITFYDPATGAVDFSSAVQLPPELDSNEATPEQWQVAREALAAIVGLPYVQGEARAGQCVKNGMLVDIVVPTPTLDEMKDARWKMIKAERDARETAGFMYQGQLLQSDARSVLRINTRGLAARAAIDAGTELTTWWKAADNTLMQLDARQMADMPTALSDYASGLHSTAGFLLAMIEAAETPAEIASVVWPE